MLSLNDKNIKYNYNVDFFYLSCQSIQIYQKCMKSLQYGVGKIGYPHAN